MGFRRMVSPSSFRWGRVIVITNLAAPTRTVFLDLTARVTSSTSDSVSDEQGLLGMAFHPGYATNRYFYLFYTGNTNTSAGSGRHDILARFQTSASDPNAGQVSTLTPIIVQLDDASNHNGGDIHFGPDGYLYVSLGDEGGSYDSGQNSQRIAKDFFSGIIRIDVDKPRALAGQLLGLEDVVGVEIGDGSTLVVRARNPRRFFRALTRLVLEEYHAVHRLEPLDDSAHAILGYLLGSGRR